MEDVYGGPSGPRLYVLSQDHYVDLPPPRTGLTLMAQAAYNDEIHETGHQTLVLTRADVNDFSIETRPLMGRALDGVRSDNRIGLQHKV
ncbi:MAG TPA: hypothetical protein VME63_05345 [Dyella sp.]|uniref:hypothetical protein n=1 Tax=Dyella sp. TaxID=1869338 RepID=UPI002BBC6D21|nr:hypothetical protein [Dyella sp.]HTV84806.1 hypothetical protein [Dyella sp.]